MTGTAIAQFLSMLASPILTRIYSPQDYGVYSLFLSMTSLVSIVATGRYEMAIMLPKSSSDVNSLLNLIFRIMAVVLVLIIIVLFFFQDQIANIFGNELSKYFSIFPTFVFLTGVTQIINYLLIREKKFKELASNKILGAVGSIGGHLIFGVFFSSPLGLILGGITGNLLACLFILKEGCLVQYYKFYKAPIKAIAKEYKDFPIYDMPSAGLNMVSLQLPIMALGKYFDMTVTGHYAFMDKILSMPTNLISRSISDVFKQKASEDYNNYGNCSVIFLKTLRFLVFAGFIPLLVLLIGAPFLFGFIFGDEWKTAGKYAQILVFLVYLRFVVSPLSYVLYIVKKQKIDLCGQILCLIVTMLAIWFGVHYNNITILLIAYTIFSSCIYLLYLFFSLNYSKR
jgi:O-antigen/teichoic acid export membrane protein